MASKGISPKAQKGSKKTGKTQPASDGTTPKDVPAGPLRIVDAKDQKETVDLEEGTVRRMYQNGKEAHSAYRNLKRQNSKRNNKNALIQKKLNLEPPYVPKKLESMGQTWRSNRPTGFMSTMISRIKPPYHEVVDTSTTLTFAKHPGQGPDADTATTTFRENITSCIRRWPGWADFMSRIITENITFGYTASENINPFNWRPDPLRQDEVFFPNDCSKDVNKIPMYGRQLSYGIHELLGVFDDPSTAQEAGWNLDNLAKSINKAVPKTRRYDGSDYARFAQDLVREGSYGVSYMEDAKYVELGKLVVREPSGRVTLFLFDEQDGSEIFTRFDYYDTMDQALNVFSLEDGTGPLMTSRGAGRDLYNTHVAVERARNLIWDNCYLAGLLVLQQEGEDRPEAAPLTVLHPVGIVSKGYNVVERSAIPANTDSFFKLEQHAVAVASALVNVFLPGQISPENQDPKTATEASYIAAIDNQIRQTILMRFYAQVVAVTTRMQKIICHPEHVLAAVEAMQKLKPDEASPLLTWAPKEVVKAFEDAKMDLPPGMVEIEIPEHLDEEAVRCVLNMMSEGLDAATILLIAHSPSSDLSPDTAAQYAQGIEAVVARYFGNPSINQQELMRRDISSKTSATVADALIIPQEDNTVMVEQVRLQKLEIASMMDGNEVPVSPRDDDVIHLDVLDQDMTPVFSSAQGTLLPQLKPALDAVVKHYAEHVESARAKGLDPSVLSKYEQQLAATQQAMEAASAELGTTPATAEVPPGVAPAAAPGAPPVLPPPTPPPDAASTVSSAAAPPAPPVPRPPAPPTT